MSEQNQHFSKTPRRIMRLPHVMEGTGYSRSWIYELMSRGEFPQAHKIGRRAVGWDSLDIDKFIAKQLGEAI